MPNPPSFEPESRTPRPSAQGAAQVGTGKRPARSNTDQSGRRGTAPQAPSRVPAKRLFESESSRQSFEHESHRSESYADQPYGRRYPDSNDERHAAIQSPSYQPPSYAPRAKLRSTVPGPAQPQAQQHTQQRAQTPRAYAPHSAAAQQFLRQTPAQAPAPARIPTDTRYTAHRRPRVTIRRVLSTCALLIVLAIAATAGWGFYLINYGNSQLTRLDALSHRKDTAGTTYLIVGSDERGETIADPTSGQRADTIMILHKPNSGNVSLISLPRDAWVQVGNYGEAKLNAAFSWGGQELLVQTVENYTGLTIDHYVQIGMDGVKELTNAVGGVELCLNQSTIDSASISEDANGNSTLLDPDSSLTWSWAAGEEESCQNADGDTALAFSRMRKADVTGDIGRGLRQRKVIGAIMHKAFTREIILSPSKQKTLVGGVASVLTVDNDDSITDVAFAGLALKNAMSNGISGAPPIADIAYWTNDGQSAVLLDPDKQDTFWQKVLDGSITQADVYDPLSGIQ